MRTSDVRDETRRLGVVRRYMTAISREEVEEEPKALKPAPPRRHAA
jgi:hypothetical protein